MCIYMYIILFVLAVCTHVYWVQPTNCFYSTQGLVSLNIFARNSISIETSLFCNSDASDQVATNFAHATTAQLPCYVQIVFY